MQALREDLPTKKGRKIALQLEPGKVLQKVPGGFIIVGGLNNTGKWTVELEPGERFHEAKRIMKVCPNCGKLYSDEDIKQLKQCLNPECRTPAREFENRVFTSGYIVQPPGAPTISPKGVSKLIGRSIAWVHKLTRRGPLDRLSGIQGYIVNSEGTGWIPKFGTGINGSEVMYYESDIADWLESGQAPPKKPEESTDKLKTMVIPEDIRKLFLQLGEEEIKEHGYVTRTSVRDKAKELTQNLNKKELKERYNLERAIQDRDYKYIMALAVQEGWKDNPRKSFNTAAYRRPPRNF